MAIRKIVKIGDDTLRKVCRPVTQIDKRILTPIKGKKIVLIDDSIVRGTTSKSLIDFVKEAEPAEIHFLVGCPPVIACLLYTSRCV